MKNKALYLISLVFGIVPVISGLTIFFILWIARTFYADDLKNLDAFSFLWMFFCTPSAIIALLLQTIVLIKNYPTHLKRPIFGLLLIFLNFPIASWVVEKQTDLENRVYIKFNNKTNLDSVELSFKGSNFEKKIGILNKSQSIVDFYYPRYVDEWGNEGYSMYSQIDTVTLIVKEKSASHYLPLPIVQKGQCEELYITNEFKLKKKLHYPL